MFPEYLPRIVYYQPVLPRASLPPSIQADLDLVRTAEIKSDSDPKFIREIKSKAENNLKGAQQKSQQKSQQKLNDHVNTWAEDFQFVERDKHRDNEKDRRIREKVLFDELQMLLQLNEKTNKVSFFLTFLTELSLLHFLIFNLNFIYALVSIVCLLIVLFSDYHTGRCHVKNTTRDTIRTTIINSEE